MTRRSWAFDASLAGVVLVLGQFEVWDGVGATHRQGPHWAQALTFALVSFALVLRRVVPLACMGFIAGVLVLDFAVFGSSEGNTVGLVPLVAVYAVARWEQRHRPLWGLVLVLALGAAWIAFDPLNTSAYLHIQGLAWVSPWVIAWLVGALVRSQLQAAEQRRLQRADRADRAVAEERNRIARELHDVIGHSVSVMTVQASAVRRRLTPQQAAERQALESVEAVGREALAEMRRMVGVLRDAEAAAGAEGAGAAADPISATREPPPNLGELDRLVEKYRTAGLPVELTISGDARQLAPGLDLTAYRLVQEGLTNALRHAIRPARAQVVVAYRAEHLELSVRDDGQPVPSTIEAGHGLLGMRERVAVYGGRLVARPRADRGFELIATLPLGVE